MSAATDFATKAMKSFRVNMTDALFLFIEHDAELKAEYQSLLKAGESCATIHLLLNKRLMKAFGLKNQPVAQASPRSTLLKRHYRLHE